MTPAEIYTKAKAAAVAAAEARNAELPPEGKRGFDCGFAWITIQPARGPFVSYLKSSGIGQSGGYDRMPGYGIWYSDLHSVPTQSIEVHKAAVRAAAAVLEENGIKAICNYRLD